MGRPKGVKNAVITLTKSQRAAELAELERLRAERADLERLLAERPDLGRLRGDLELDEPAKRANGEDVELGGEDQIAFSSLLSQLGERERQAMVTVFKVDESKRIQARLFEKPLVEFLAGGQDDLARDYGTGAYYVHVWHPKTGHLLTRRRLDLVQLPGQAQSSAEKPRESAPLGLTELLTILDRQQATAFQMVEKIAAALGGRAAAAPSVTVQDVVGLVSSLQGMVAKSSNGGGLGGLKDLVETFGAIKSLVGNAGEANEQSVMLEAVRQFGGPIAEAIRQARGGSPAPASTPAQIPPPAAPGATAGPAVQPNEESPAMFYKLYLRLLVQHAQAGNDPETYANVILDTVGPDQVRAFLERPDWLQQLSALEPMVANFPTWFSELRRLTLELLTTESAPPDTAEKTKPAEPPPAA
jgi:hypothetical protein